MTKEELIRKLLIVIVCSPIILTGWLLECIAATVVERITN